jgi:hypothetical protein
METNIMQAEGLLRLKKMLFKANRCTQTDVDAAEDALNALLIDIASPAKLLTPKVKPIPVMNVMPFVALPEVKISGERVDNYEELQAGFSAEAKMFKDAQAETSNAIVASYRANPEINVKGLMQEAIGLRTQVEGIWDKKMYLTRNGHLKAEVLAEETVEESEEVFQHKYVLAGKRKLIKDQIYKLEKKINDPTKHVKFDKAEAKINVWRKELMILQNDLQLLNLEIATK